MTTLSRRVAPAPTMQLLPMVTAWTLLPTSTHGAGEEGRTDEGVVADDGGDDGAEVVDVDAGVLLDVGVLTNPYGSNIA